ncbi:MAG: HupE/UreJ family protein [Gammaproteobacteria bacterium]|jgi:urease accessory protein
MKFRYRAFFLTLILLIPEIVFAHGPIKGIGNFYNGVLHPVFVPSQLLLLSVLGLLIGQKGIDKNLLSLATFAFGTFFGLTLAWFSFAVEMEAFLLGGALTLGLLVALDFKFNPTWLSLIAFFTGLAIGMDSTQETLAGREKVATLFGTGVGLYLLQLYPMGLADYFNNKPWQRIGIRIIGSWIAAIAFLVLALAISPYAQAFEPAPALKSVLLDVRDVEPGILTGR